MTRLDNWKSRLAVYILENQSRPFEPGKWDCMLFGAGGLEAVTGIDAAADFRGRYSTLEGGVKLLLKAGFSDHVSLIDSLLPRVAWTSAVAGDVAAVPGDDGSPAVGIVQGGLIYALAPTGGYRLVPLDQAIAVWEVR